MLAEGREARPQELAANPAASAARRASLALQREARFHRHVIARLFPAAHVRVDGDALEAVGGLRGEQQVVDADAFLALPAEGLEVPEGEAGLVGDGAYRICQAEVLQRP